MQFCTTTFDHEVSLDDLIEVFDLWRRTPLQNRLIVINRVQRFKEQLGSALDLLVSRQDCSESPLVQWLATWIAGRAPEHVWFALTVSNQVEADRDIPVLMRLPASRRYLSMRPLLGPVELTHLPPLSESRRCCSLQRFDALRGRTICDLSEDSFQSSPSIDGVLVAGETGEQARPMHPAWVSNLRAQCEVAGVPFFFEDWGQWVPVGRRAVNGRVQ